MTGSWPPATGTQLAGWLVRIAEADTKQMRRFFVALRHRSATSAEVNQ